MEKIQFDFFRGMDAEQYTFYRIPKILFTAEYFRPLSCEAKVLYGLLLDRMGLSIKNRWLDEEDRVYIIFKIEEIVELMNCGTQKAVKLLKELDTDKGMGLIEKKRLGLGKPNVIYVKNFIIRQEEGNGGEKEHWKQSDTQDCENQNARTVKTTISEFPRPQEQNCENENSGMMRTTISEFPGPQAQNCENQNSGMMKTTIPEFPEPQIQNCENQNPEMMNITILDFPKSQSNNTKISDINPNENNYNETELKETESVREECIDSNPIKSDQSIPNRAPDAMGRMDACRDVIRENISYECFQDERFHRTEEVDELIELMVEVMQMPDDSILRIAGTEKPAAVVKSRFMKLNQGHMEYIMSCLAKNAKKVGNIKAYLLTVLYNATLTVNNFYTAEVAHAMC